MPELKTLDEALAALDRAADDPGAAERLLLDVDRALGLGRNRSDVDKARIATAVIPFARAKSEPFDPNAPIARSALRALVILRNLAPALPEDALSVLRDRSQEVTQLGSVALEGLGRVPTEAPLAVERARSHLLAIDLESESGYPTMSSDASVATALGVLGRLGPAARACVPMVVDRCLMSPRVERLNLAHVVTVALEAIVASGELPADVAPVLRNLQARPRSNAAVRARIWTALSLVTPPLEGLIEEMIARLPQADAGEAAAIVEVLGPHVPRDPSVREAVGLAARRLATASVAIRMLGTAGCTREALEAVDMLASSKEATDRASAVRALEQLLAVSPEATPRLLALARDRSKDVRATVVYALQRLPAAARGTEVDAALRQLAKDKVAAIRDAASRALQAG